MIPIYLYISTVISLLGCTCAMAWVLKLKQMELFEWKALEQERVERHGKVVDSLVKRLEAIEIHGEVVWQNSGNYYRLVKYSNGTFCSQELTANLENNMSLVWQAVDSEKSKEIWHQAVAEKLELT